MKQKAQTNQCRRGLQHAWYLGVAEQAHEGASSARSSHAGPSSLTSAITQVQLAILATHSPITDLHTCTAARVNMHSPSTLVLIISTQEEVTPLHKLALLRPRPALLTRTSMPWPGHRLAMMRGTATTSASCTHRLGSAATYLWCKVRKQSRCRLHPAECPQHCCVLAGDKI